MRQKIKRYPVIVWVDEIDIQPRGASDTTAQVEYALFKEGSDGSVVGERKTIDVPIQLLGAFISKDRNTINMVLAQNAPPRQFMDITLPPMQLEDEPVVTPDPSPVNPAPQPNPSPKPTPTDTPPSSASTDTPPAG